MKHKNMLRLSAETEVVWGSTWGTQCYFVGLVLFALGKRSTQAFGCENFSQLEVKQHNRQANVAWNHWGTNCRHVLIDRFFFLLTAHLNGPIKFALWWKHRLEGEKKMHRKSRFKARGLLNLISAQESPAVLKQITFSKRSVHHNGCREGLLSCFKGKSELRWLGRPTETEANRGHDVQRVLKKNLQQY